MYLDVMKRSPLVLTLVLVLCAASAHPQANSPQPQSGSGAPKTPLAHPPDHPLSPESSNGPSRAAVGSSNSAGGSGNASVSDEELALEPIVAVPTAADSTSQPPRQPKTEILDSSATAPGLATDGHDPLLDPPPPPTGMTTLVGGTIRSVDHIRNKMTIAAFAGNRWKIAFDERTHIFLNGAETTQAALRKGERVYVDTMLDEQKHDVFARNIRLGLAAPAADADGQIIEFDEGRGTVTLRDQINSVPVRFSVLAGTKIVYGKHPLTLHELKPGSLVHVSFSPEQSNSRVAREITILAAPGAQFTYVGKITYLDVHRGILAMQDTLDQRNYEVYFDPARVQDRNDLAVGSQIRLVAVFEGHRYSAQSITLIKTADAEQ